MKRILKNKESISASATAAVNPAHHKVPSHYLIGVVCYRGERVVFLNNHECSKGLLRNFPETFNIIDEEIKYRMAEDISEAMKHSAAGGEEAVNTLMQNKYIFAASYIAAEVAFSN